MQNLCCKKSNLDGRRPPAKSAPPDNAGRWSCQNFIKERRYVSRIFFVLRLRNVRWLDEPDIFNVHRWQMLHCVGRCRIGICHNDVQHAGNSQYWCREVILQFFEKHIMGNMFTVNSTLASSMLAIILFGQKIPLSFLPPRYSKFLRWVLFCVEWPQACLLHVHAVEFTQPCLYLYGPSHSFQGYKRSFYHLP